MTKGEFLNSLIRYVGIEHLKTTNQTQKTATTSGSKGWDHNGHRSLIF